IPVIGNPNFSKTGNSEASAVTAPNTTITVLVIESNLRMLSSIYLNLFAALAKQDPVCARNLMHCRNRPGGTNVINSQNLGDGRGLAALVSSADENGESQSRTSWRYSAPDGFRRAGPAIDEESRGAA